MTLHESYRSINSGKLGRNSRSVRGSDFYTNRRPPSGTLPSLDGSQSEQSQDGRSKRLLSAYTSKVLMSVYQLKKTKEQKAKQAADKWKKALKGRLPKLKVKPLPGTEIDYGEEEDVARSISRAALQDVTEEEDADYEKLLTPESEVADSPSSQSSSSQSFSTQTHSSPLKKALPHKTVKLTGRRKPLQLKPVYVPPGMTEGTGSIGDDDPTTTLETGNQVC